MLGSAPSLAPSISLVLVLADRPLVVKVHRDAHRSFDVDVLVVLVVLVDRRRNGLGAGAAHLDDVVLVLVDRNLT